MAETRPFLIPVKRRWTLWILPVIAVLYFIGVVVLVSMNYRITGVSNDLLALVGLGLFALVVLIELPFLLRRRPRRAEPDPVEAEPYAEAAPLAATGAARDDELRTTPETQQGLRVVEYSAPAKSRNRNAVFTKTYVPVTPTHVLRIETLVADASDL